MNHILSVGSTSGLNSSCRCRRVGDRSRHKRRARRHVHDGAGRAPPSSQSWPVPDMQAFLRDERTDVFVDPGQSVFEAGFASTRKSPEEIVVRPYTSRTHRPYRLRPTKRSRQIHEVRENRSGRYFDGHSGRESHYSHSRGCHSSAGLCQTHYRPRHCRCCEEEPSLSNRCSLGIREIACL